MLVGVMSFLLLAVVAYFAPRVLYIRKLNRWYPQRLKDAIENLQQTPFQSKVVVLVFSYLRYMVFVLQFVLVLTAFSNYPNSSELLLAIAVVYLLMTVTPSVFFGKLLVREAAALFVLSTLSISNPVILISGFVLWFINLALPSLVGATLLFSKK